MLNVSTNEYVTTHEKVPNGEIGVIGIVVQRTANKKSKVSE